MPTILITGTNRGIGLELTRQYLQEGWRVLACSRNPAQADELQSLKQQHANLLTLAELDLHDEKQIRALSNAWKNESIDILFNNAAIMGPHHIELGDLSVKDWQEVFLINTIAPILMAQAFVEQIARSQQKIIATMSSLMGSIADNQWGKYYYYRSSKVAMNAAMKSLAIDLSNQNIIGVVLNPGWVKTDMGGENAPLSVSQCVKGLRQVLNQLTPAESGKFLSYTGTEVPW